MPWGAGIGLVRVMAGGSGKYNRQLVADLAATAAEAPPAQGRDVGGPVADLAGALEPDAAAAGAMLPVSRRHCWALGPPEDPGPHPALLTSPWARRGPDWFVKVTWYSEARDALVQQWLDYPN